MKYSVTFSGLTYEQARDLVELAHDSAEADASEATATVSRDTKEDDSPTSRRRGSRAASSEDDTTAEEPARGRRGRASSASASTKSTEEDEEDEGDEISDADLVKAVTEASALVGPAAVKETVAEFAKPKKGKKTVSVSDIPDEDRQEFLDALDKLSDPEAGEESGEEEAEERPRGRGGRRSGGRREEPEGEEAEEAEERPSRRRRRG